jgi:hypothetical protein
MVIGQDVLNEASTYLGLTAKSGPIAAQMPDGTGEGTAPTVDGTTQLLKWITEGMDRIARLTLPISDIASAQASAAGPNGIVGPFSTIQSIAGRTLYVPTFVNIDDTELTATNLGFLNNQTWFPPTPDGDPTAWVNTTSYIDLSYFTTQPNFTIQGYFLPIPVVDVSTPIDTFFDDYATRASAFYVAWMVAAKNRENEVLQAREIPCLNEFVGSVKEMYSRLIQTDPSLSAIFPAAPIDSLLQVLKQLTPRN